ncbi:MAG: hypothetical protein U0T83_06000 [Bacteriovoracaceae bacterium]
MKSDFDTLKGLASYILNHLNEKKYIVFSMENRIELIESLAVELNVSFATDEDIRSQAIEEVEEKMGEAYVAEHDITETEMFNHAKKEIIKSFQGENIAGLHLVESLFQVTNRVKSFLFNSNLIEDVFASDEEIINLLIEKIKKFTIARA